MACRHLEEHFNCSDSINGFCNPFLLFREILHPLPSPVLNELCISEWQTAKVALEIEQSENGELVDILRELTSSVFPCQDEQYMLERMETLKLMTTR